jgi:RHS repeat-associated protein
MKQEHDAEGNVTAVDGGTTATYTYDALNHRVRAVVGTTATEYVFNAAGQRVSEWNGSNYTPLKGHYYWGSKPVAYYTTAYAGAAATHFEHQDWMGTERVRTTYNGTVEGTYTSLPYGDNSAASGTDTDANHYAMLDHDSESGTDHAQFRQYGNTQGRFMSPDPYDGSYDPSNPQSFNRYAYAMNNPVSYIDPSGLEDITDLGNGCYQVTTDADSTDRLLDENGNPLSGTTVGSQQKPIVNIICTGFGNSMTQQQVLLSFPITTGGGGGSSAPNNNKPSWYNCAGQSLAANWKQVGLDALGLIPLESTGVKAAQLAGGIVSGAISAYNQDGPGTGFAGVGTVLNILNAEKGSIAKNLAEAIPIAGTVVSAGAVGWDVFGSKEYSTCRNGAS